MKFTKDMFERLAATAAQAFLSVFVSVIQIVSHLGLQEAALRKFTEPVCSLHDLQYR